MDNARTKIQKLAATAPPAMKPVLDLVSQLIDTAQSDREKLLGEIEYQSKRADRAESLAADARVVVEKAAAYSASLEESIAAREEAQRVEVSKREEQSLVDVITKITEAIKAAPAAIAKARAGTVTPITLMAAAHQRIHDENGHSAIKNRNEDGYWVVRDADGNVIASCTQRSKAIGILRAAMQQDLDDLDERREQSVATTPFPQGAGPGLPQGQDDDPDDLVQFPGLVDGKRIRRKRVTKRRPRIL